MKILSDSLFNVVIFGLAITEWLAQESVLKNINEVGFMGYFVRDFFSAQSFTQIKI